MVMNRAQYLEKGLFSGPPLIFGRNNTDCSCQSPCHHLLPGHVYVGQSKQNSPLAFVLRNAAITGFSMAKEILDDVKGVLNARPDAGLQSFRVLDQSFDFALRKLLHLATLSGNLPIDVLAFILRSLGDTRIARISKDNRVIRQEQLSCHGDIAHIGCGTYSGVSEA